jgi:hypothetical protein
MTARAVLVALAALLIAVQVVSSAAVDAWFETAPQRAADVWPDHPSAELSLAMTDIAKAMRDRKPVGASVFKLIDDAATKAPLAAEPYLVDGVEAKVAGDTGAAERDFLAAQRRDPRSLAAAYFLADHYVRTRNAVGGIRQIAILARLTPGGAQNVAPYLAAYAQDRSNWPLLRAQFRSDPGMRDAALTALAGNPANADIVVSLADAAHRAGSASWLPSMLASLVNAGQYDRARSIWASFSGVRLDRGELLFDSGFSQSAPPPPFNWDLTSSTVGLAERRPGGTLHAMFYGQEGGALARQLLVLPPGSYRLSMRLLGGSSHPEALSWSLRCDKGQELARTGLDQAAARGWAFQVPTGCAAQWFELNGSSSDMPQQSDATITRLSLTRGGRGA